VKLFRRWLFSLIISRWHFRWLSARRSDNAVAMSDVSLILERADSGDSAAADELLPLVYEELRKLAAHRMAHESPNQTPQPDGAGACRRTRKNAAGWVWSQHMSA